MIRSSFLLLGCLSVVICGAAERSGFYLKDGDRIVFYGDSITDQRLYTTFVETYAVTRFPTMQLQFVHSGWGGDRVTGGAGGDIDLRLKRDVFAYKPTVMTIMLGMNDASYRAFDQKIFSAYTNGYEHIIASLKEHLPHLRLTLIRPSPFDDVTREPKFEGGYNQVLVRYGEFVKQLASRNGATVADLNSGVVAATLRAKNNDEKLSVELNSDRVHPGPAGQLLMAAELLKAWRAPSLVTDVQINAARKKIVHSAGTKVSGLTTGETITWTQTDTALPMPIPIGANDPVMALAVSSSDVIDSLNKQMLKVTGLEADSYKLKIDGANITEFSKQQLADGVNLAVLPTPMFKQASQVHVLTIKHNDLHFTRWRTVQVPWSEHKNSKIRNAVPALLEGFDEEEAAAVEEQRAAAQPKPHRFELVPAS